MTIQVTGILKNPLDMPLANVEIRVTAKTSEGMTVSNLRGIATTDASGNYTFSLVNGMHDIEVKYDDEWFLLGTATVTDSSTSPTSLPDIV